MLIIRLIAGTIVSVVLFAVLLFGSAGTWDWPRAWVFLGLSLGTTLASTLSLLRGRRDLLVERLKPGIQQGQPLADKIVLL